MSGFRRLFVMVAAMAAPALCAAAKPDIENGKATFNTMCSV